MNSAASSFWQLSNLTFSRSVFHVVLQSRRTQSALSSYIWNSKLSALWWWYYPQIILVLIHNLVQLQTKSDTISILKHITTYIKQRVHVGVNIISQFLHKFNHFILEPQCQPPYANHEIHHERYSPQLYPTYHSKSTPLNMHNPADSRRSPPLTTSPAPPGDRWQQPSFVQPANGFPRNSIRSPTASYPPAYMSYPTNPANAYS